ncbi:MAG: hypothetical protein ACREBS_04310 [Nitrososphaerales archaeon]
MKIRKTLLVALPVIAIVSLISLVAILSPAPRIPSSCTSIITKGFKHTESGFAPVCGNGSATDGRLEILVHNYYFAHARDIPFEPSSSVGPSEVFLLVNVTVSNVGSGNTSIGGGFYDDAIDGSQVVGNGEYVDNVTFLKDYPNHTMPAVEGGVFLPPGSRQDIWLLFYIPTADNGNNQTTISLASFRLQYLLFNEQGYGGDYEGGGAFICMPVPCENPKMQFIISVQ